jgi:hypothetical protein
MVYQGCYLLAEGKRGQQSGHHDTLQNINSITYKLKGGGVVQPHDWPDVMQQINGNTYFLQGGE